MSEEKSLRVMWLLNHTTARKFEISMLKKIGVNQIFTPKSFPQDQSFRTASIDYSEDASLEIPKDDLAILNATDWYDGVPEATWELANKYFDVIFFLPMNREALDSLSKHFRGIAIWRIYGRDKSASYDLVLNDYIARNGYGGVCIRRMGRRFRFGEAYSHIADTEPPYLRDRRVFLPLGLANAEIKDKWEGKERKIYFVCPEIASSPIYGEIYRNFKKAFEGVPYIVAGAQPISVNDERVLGYVTDDEHAYNMAQSRVMFYHSQEPNHIHYHPFEAIRAGMPLVFMAGGMLDRMGGVGLPGRCKTVVEARRKIEAILAGNQELIQSIRHTQTVLLQSMIPENCEPAWRTGFAQIASSLAEVRAEQAMRPSAARKKRIAVVLPVAYRGGSLRGVQALAHAIHMGSHQSGDAAEVVFLHPDEPFVYSDSDFDNFPKEIKRRPFKWRTLSSEEASRAMRYAGYENWRPASEHYLVPEDGIRNLQDCNLWIIVSHRMIYPILPLKPVVLMMYDFLQRYVDVIPQRYELMFLSAVRSAEKILVTSEFTRKDALQYAGIESKKVSKVPMLAPEFEIKREIIASLDEKDSYFIWTTNSTPHKNHKNSLEALHIYYEEMDGTLDCRVTGVNSRNILVDTNPQTDSVAKLFRENKLLKRRVKWMGELPDSAYRKTLANAKFIWHSGKSDNGTFSVIEGACLNVPALSSDYPAMREIDEQFSLRMAWMDPESPRDMAKKLKMMENNIAARRDMLPSEALLRAQSIGNHAKKYWQEVRACL